jgi:hypothetical protein
MAKIEITQPAGSGGGGTVNEGVLQIQGGGPITNSSQRITDQSGNTSPLYISSTALTVTTPTSASAITRVIIQGSTDSAGYILRAVNRTGLEIFNIKDDGSVLSTGPLSISTIQNATTDTDKFLVSDAGVIKYRTGAEVLSDIGLTNPVTGTGTADFVTYWTGSNSVAGNSGLVFNSATQRLGIGGVGPSTTLHVLGTTTTTSLIVSTATAQSTTATQYLSLDAADSTVKYRTPAQVLSDIGAQATLTNPVTGTGTATRVAFWSSASAISSSTALNWDNTNGRLGIGVAAPSARLQVTGDGVANTVRFESSTSTNLFTLSDQGRITAFSPATTALSGTTEINKFTSSFIAPSAGSGSFRPLSIAYTINNTGAQTGTATGIFLSATETALGGMTHNLLDLQVGGASKFSVDSSGQLQLPGPIYFTVSGLSIGRTNLPRIFTTSSTNANLSINPLGITASSSGYSTTTASSVFEIVSTTQGFLLPRMTTAQRNSISSPANGLMVYDTDLSQPCFYETTAARWNKLSHTPA